MSPSRKAKLVTPPGSCDCHIHIYGTHERYPLAPSCRYPPPLATPPMYRAVMQRLNLDRVILVQPTAYGDDNRCLLDALADFKDAARGIFLVTPETSAQTLKVWNEAGGRGARFFMLPGAILTWDMLEPVARMISEFGWHIQLQLDGRMLADYEELILRLPCPVVIDHNGKFLGPVTPDHPGMQSLLRLLDSGKVWVKASAPYETSKTGAPDYSDVSAIAKQLISAAPDRMVWASNWPHGAQKHKPDDVGLLDLLMDWAVSDDIRQRILVENPNRLYF
ncbi:MAG TPA: amidohydrolase family protein [Pseudolabrys sp.]|jgi:D-galactarolactone isomerase|nr:amidohydrolase family protein [Pseudolabrys sp.]